MERERDDRIMRLAKPMKKGFLRLIFSRFFLVVLLVILQMLILATVYMWAAERVPILTRVQVVFTIAMIIYLFNKDMDSTAKLTWMLIIAIFPLPGAAFLLFTQTNLGHRREKQRVAEQTERTRSMLKQDPRILKDLEADGSGLDDLCRYMNLSGCFPVYKNTDVQYFPSGEAKFEALLEELDKAEKYIYLEYYILEEGYMWGRVLDILTRKVQEGVDVRVMYDGMCYIAQLPYGYWKLLREWGIKAKVFSAPHPFLSSHHNYRDHRKILVIDGKVAFTGGVNLADEYINRVQRFGHWKDAAVMLKGPAVKSFELMFLQMWNLDEKEPDYSTCETIPEAKPEYGEGYVLPYCDSPLDSDKVGEIVYMDILNRATEYVHIMSPYLILDDEMATALKYAARRGVDVKIILPGIPDKRLAYALAKSQYKALVAAGVQIYEYTPGFVHSKIFVSDDTKAVVGTINLDYRSLYHHFECAAYFYKAPCVADVERDFEETLEKCRQVTPETIRDEKLDYKIMGTLMRFMAPLM